MKYVIFKMKAIFIPVIMPEHGTHSCLKIEGAEPVSAGFFHINRMGLVEIDAERGSESLGLYPEPDDISLLMGTLCGAPVSSYLDYGYINNLQNGNQRSIIKD